MNRNQDKANFKNKQSYIECPTCEFVRKVNPSKHKDPNWDKICNRCVSEENFKLQLPIGGKFGDWIVVDHQFIRQKNKTLVNVRCMCGDSKSVASWTLLAGTSRSCTKCAYKKAFKGYEQLSITYYNQIERAAKRRNHAFCLTIANMWDQYQKQMGKCVFTGLDLTLTNSNNFNLQTASLDRIDSSKGYTPDNIQWIHKDANKMKMDLPEQDFFRMIKEIYEHKQLNK